MPRFFTAIVFLATLWAVSAERSSAAMWLVRGPANTSMAADPACKGREIGPNAPDDDICGLTAGLAKSTSRF